MSSPTTRTWDSEVYSDQHLQRLLPPIESSRVDANDKPQKLVVEAGLIKALSEGHRYNTEWSTTYNIKIFTDQVMFPHSIWRHPSWLDWVHSTTDKNSTPDFLQRPDVQTRTFGMHGTRAGGYPLPFLTVPVGAEILCGAPECLYKSFSALTREGASN